MPTKKATVVSEEAITCQTEDNASLEASAQAAEPDAALSESGSPQTDSENGIGNNPSENASPDTEDSALISQTETDESEIPAAFPEDALNSSEKSGSAQTENKSDELLAPEVPVTAASLENAADSQTEPEKPKKTRRRKRDPEENQTQSDTEPNSEETPSADGVETSAKPKLRISLPKRADILSIDDQLGVITDADKAKDDLLDLLESYRSKKHLSGTIQGIENQTGDPAKALAVLNYGEYKVIIPLHEAVEPPENLKGQPLDHVLNYMLNKRLGAEIDYIVKGIDAKEKIVVASRVEAMHNKRKNYYFGTDRDGNYILYSDLCAEVRVVSVVRSGIFVDLFGLEVFIPLRELSYQRLMDAEGYFAPGQRTLVKVLEVDRADRRNIKVKASVKQAGENPYDKALRKYTVGNRYVGTVSLVDTNGVFVSLDGGIDCLCNYPKRGRPPKGARVTVRVLGINYDTNRIWGVITHIAAAR